MDDETNVRVKKGNHFHVPIIRASDQRWMLLNIIGVCNAILTFYMIVDNFYNVSIFIVSFTVPSNNWVILQNYQTNGTFLPSD